MRIYSIIEVRYGNPPQVIRTAIHDDKDKFIQGTKGIGKVFREMVKDNGYSKRGDHGFDRKEPSFYHITLTSIDIE